MFLLVHQLELAELSSNTTSCRSRGFCYNFSNFREIESPVFVCQKSWVTLEKNLLIRRVCCSKTFVHLVEKLSASVYTDLKGAISSLYQISDFQLVGCKNSVVLKNVIRNLPRNLQTITLVWYYLPFSSRVTLGWGSDESFQVLLPMVTFEQAMVHME